MDNWLDYLPQMFALQEPRAFPLSKQRRNRVRRRGAVPEVQAQRLGEATQPRPADLKSKGLPGSAASVPKAHTRAGAGMERAPAAAARTAQVSSAPLLWAAWLRWLRGGLGGRERTRERGMERGFGTSGDTAHCRPGLRDAGDTTEGRGGAAGMGVRGPEGRGQTWQGSQAVAAITPMGTPPSATGPAAPGFESRLPRECGRSTPPWSWAWAPV